MTSRRSNPIVLALLGLITLSPPALAQSEKSVVVVVNVRQSQWPDGNLDGKLADRLAASNSFVLADSLEAVEVHDRIGSRFDRQAAVDAGLSTANRFVVWCDLDKQQIATERGLAFPFLAKQRRITARLNMTYRIVDCQRGRTVASDEIALKRFGPSSMQYLDFTDADSDLYLSYEARKELYDRLEQEAVEIVAERIEELARQR